jgi:aspartyl-tRNA(Asn)/glutamyl-tRNA(Gln) amidotransferase subunit A
VQSEDLHQLGATEAARLIRTRQISSTELVQALLDRINELAEQTGAWAAVTAERALEAASRADAALSTPDVMPGGLHGVPFGVKDVIDTAGVATAAAFRPFRDRVPVSDADVVVALKKAGAVMIGKTTTTQFAFADPSTARNPWSQSRTAGGSSSGSAVAVATRQVPLALGTQTGGSTLRPAAFNGVIGFKPTLGLVRTAGLLPLSWTLDHVGILTRDVEDVRTFLDAVTERRPTQATEAGTRPTEAPRLGLLMPALDEACAEVRTHVGDVADRFVANGASLAEVDFGLPLDLILAAQRLIVQVEVAAVHRSLLYRNASEYLPLLRACVEVGQAVPAPAYVDALRLGRLAASRLEEQLAQHDLDALLCPTVASEAPGPETTGDPSLQNPFTLAGMPSISLPSGLSGNGLPLAVQLAARRDNDLQLLDVAEWCAARLEQLPAPPRRTEPQAAVLTPEDRAR